LQNEILQKLDTTVRQIKKVSYCFNTKDIVTHTALVKTGKT